MSLTSVCSWFVFIFVCTSSLFTHVWITSVFTILYIQFKNYWSLFKSRSFFTLLRYVSIHLKLSQMINFCFQNKLLEIVLFQKSGDQSCDWWCRGNRCCPILKLKGTLTSWIHLFTLKRDEVRLRNLSSLQTLKHGQCFSFNTVSERVLEQRIQKSASDQAPRSNVQNSHRISVLFKFICWFTYTI